MNWVDIALAGLLVVSVLVGAWRGLVFEVMTLAGWVVAYVASPFVAPVIERFIPIEKVGPTLLHALGLVLAFVLVLLIWGIGAKLIRAVIHATPLGVLDRLGGAAFGVLRAVLVALLATVIVDMTPAAQSPPGPNRRSLRGCRPRLRKSGRCCRRR